ncbi:MAG: 50S ribosomal protein L32 [Candidatus Portnoybacteria bacterium RIFCSPLOWO2_12_FULL_39_9]|uniref:Large ribosomal subunit protein bL32 n=1 Tax=Candidatus Portnoybacteria bacterium RIFCSPHIGHO2_12_FULL_38_9 TaxID=1801997 RepID=A0A1G2FG01_9BACT|nr:MAG: 50S ribosomal protein L32 [Candidatus Portnoybacteria bacterium RBG_13_40_8]OGZ36043.1 MAG: 50S ribosomal protein L32 [Candidatus Portnoybacteria bacterium RIFCSPHIGHO2_02_FULL_39_12]OGZ36732.1 MAG: 50S ribosomal protein L32 [Candidatus Portnoybacteria bacterium RIFCSPHIGHO2_12_FULL_38_9]OGZ38091.1 MAG: 50S ribosomal protein L32 [Candidatus Portnoybacteria bacterium RIFCSPLOWO2_01_FULL_38_39]OGZ40098.1 MAG: 50S ribosomal protein L32 [Candidatus Portnoybacteria bacterium RIFCSPLOWO2_12_F
MPVPKQRHTKSRRNRRRSHHALKKQSFSLCQKCKTPVIPHTLCLNCGAYNNREVIDVLAKLTKREKKKKEKEMATQEKEQAEEGKGLTMEELSRKD